MFVNFSEEVKHILKQAEKERDDLNHPYIGSEHLFLSILKNNKLKYVFKKNYITYNKFRQKLINVVGIGSKKSEFVLYTPMLKRIIENSIIEAREEKINSVTPDILILSILEEDDGIACSILKSLRINMDKLYFDIKNNNKVKKNKKSLLDEIGIDLTLMAKEKKLDPTIGRDLEIKNLVKILLRRKKNNPILIGDAGVGKTAIVEGLANLIVSSDCPLYLKNKRIISVNIFSMVSGTKYRGEFEEKMKHLIKELEEDNNIILFIDEIHTLVGAGGAEGAIDASNILKPALARGTIKIIGATTIDEYKKYIEPDEALSRRFQNIMIKEPSYDNVINILKNIKPIYEKHHNLIINDDVIEEIVRLSDKYLINRYEPDKSIDILDEVCSSVRLNDTYINNDEKKLIDKLRLIKKGKKKLLELNKLEEACKLRKEEVNILSSLKVKDKRKIIIKKQDIMDVIKDKANINLDMFDNSNNYYDNIKNNIEKEVLGQSKNIDKLIYSLRKKNILKEKKCHSILIEGKKLSGKTLLANSYLSNLFSKNNIMKLDLSEYKEYHHISKLIGTTAGYLGYDNKNNIFDKIRINPNYGIIIDNFYMASPEIQNMFIKILEEGKIEDASGKTIDFSYTTIIFTLEKEDNLNLGFNNNNVNIDDNKLNNLVDVKINMNEVDNNVLTKIIEKNLNNSLKKYNNIKVEYTKDYLEYITNKIKLNNLSELKNIISNDFEYKITNAILSNKNSILIDCVSGS